MNARVNYPVKRVLIRMEERQLLNMSGHTNRFCVSFVACNICARGIHRFVSSWNHHSVSGMKMQHACFATGDNSCLSVFKRAGVPEQRAAENNQVTPILPHLVLSVADAKQMY